MEAPTIDQVLADLPPMISTTDLASAYTRHTGISLNGSTVRRMCQSEAIDATRVGLVWMITKDVAARFLASGWRPYDSLRRKGDT